MSVPARLRNNLRRKRSKVDRLERALDEARDEWEDLMLEARSSGASTTELGALTGVRRESAHYAIARARARANGGAT